MKINTETATHYQWGDNCDGWHLVRQESLSVIQERMPPATSEVRHFHSLSRQFFYVLEGELTIECDGVVNQLLRGDGLEIAPGSPHQVRNASASAVSFLVVSQPMAQGDRQPA